MHKFYSEMSSSQDQHLMEVDQQTMASCNQSHSIFLDSKADLIDLLKESCLDMATKLMEVDLITDQLYDKISTKDLVYSEYERTRAMLQTIYSKLKTPRAASIMENFIKVLRMEQLWHAIADLIGKYV